MFCCLYVNNYGWRASWSEVSPKMAPFLLVGIRYTQIFIDAPVYFVFLLAMLAKGWNWYNRRIIWPAFLEFWHTAHFVRASVIFSDKTVHTNSLWLFVVGFHFYFLTVVKSWLWNNSYKIIQFTVDKQQQANWKLALKRSSRPHFWPFVINFPPSALLSGNFFTWGLFCGIARVCLDFIFHCSRDRWPVLISCSHCSSRMLQLH